MLWDISQQQYLQFTRVPTAFYGDRDFVCNQEKNRHFSAHFFPLLLIHSRPEPAAIRSRPKWERYNHHCKSAVRRHLLLQNCQKNAESAPLSHTYHVFKAVSCRTSFSELYLKQTVTHKQLLLFQSSYHH